LRAILRSLCRKLSPAFLSVADSRILAGCLVLLLFPGKRPGERGGCCISLIFALLGWLSHGENHPFRVSSNHLIILPTTNRYTFEGVLYQPPEPLPDKTRLYVRGERIFSGRGRLRFQETSFLPSGYKGESGYGDRVRFITKLYRPASGHESRLPIAAIAPGSPQGRPDSPGFVSSSLSEGCRHSGRQVQLQGIGACLFAFKEKTHPPVRVSPAQRHWQ